MQSLVYGIDFGTTNTSVGVVKNGKAQILPLDPKAPNPYILRSIIYATKEGDFYFGQEAIVKYNADLARGRAARRETIRTGNRIKVSSDPSARTGFKPDKIVEEVYEAEVTDAGKLMQGIKSLLGHPFITSLPIFDRTYSVEEIVALFLEEVRNRANTHMEQDISQAVIGRPVEFVGGDNQVALKRLGKAAALAGFDQVQFELEPLGAAFDFSTTDHTPQTVLVFDFGGGTLDLSIVVFPRGEVVINTGMPLGGDLINSRIFKEKIAAYFGRGERYGKNQNKIPEHIYTKLQHWYSISLLKNKEFARTLERLSYKNSNPQALRNLESLVFDHLGFRLYEEIDRVKKKLSHHEQTDFHLELNNAFIQESLKREEFEAIIQADLERIDDLIRKTLKKARLKDEDISVVVLTGGSSLIPSVRHLIAKHFGNEKLAGKDTFTSVASGLALSALNTF